MFMAEELQLRRRDQHLQNIVGRKKQLQYKINNQAIVVKILESPTVTSPKSESKSTPPLLEGNNCHLLWLLSGATRW